MATQSIQNSLDAVMQRIDAMIEELSELRQTLQAVGQRVNSSTNLEDAQVPLQKISAIEILAQERTFSMFESEQQVDEYVREERASWAD